jgi:hypothetical protein
MFSPHFLQRIVKSQCRVCGRLNTSASIGEQKRNCNVDFSGAEPNQIVEMCRDGRNLNYFNGLWRGMLIRKR